MEYEKPLMPPDAERERMNAEFVEKTALQLLENRSTVTDTAATSRDRRRHSRAFGSQAAWAHRYGVARVHACWER